MEYQVPNLVTSGLRDFGILVPVLVPVLKGLGGTYPSVWKSLMFEGLSFLHMSIRVGFWYAASGIQEGLPS